jgi:hypothetical protein
MAKTHHRRHRVSRTRRGGVPKKPNGASASTNALAALDAPAVINPELQKILDRVKALAAQGQTPIKPSRRSGISKSQAAKNRFAGIMEGKVSHSTKKPVSKHGSHNRPAADQ